MNKKKKETVKFCEIEQNGNQGKPKPVRAHEREVGKGEKMKSIMISIQPKWCAKIESGAKTIEVRKTRPKIETPFKCYIYCTKGKDILLQVMKDGDENYGEIYHGKPVFIKIPDKYYKFEQSGKVIGEFVCDRIICSQAYYDDSGKCHLTNLFGIDIERTCLTEHEIFNYIIGKNKKIGTGWLWHISELKIYDRPKELGENGDFKFPCVRGGEDFYTHRKCMDCKYACRWAGTMEIYCDRWVTRPPQSWCYVEELEE